MITTCYHVIMYVLYHLHVIFPYRILLELSYTGPEEAICEWSGQNFTQYSCTNERILLEIVTQLQCAKHTPKCEA